MPVGQGVPWAIRVVQVYAVGRILPDNFGQSAEDRSGCTALAASLTRDWECSKRKNLIGHFNSLARRLNI